jgi:hypothetical protein
MNELGMSEKSESRVEYGISEISKRKMMEEYLKEKGIVLDKVEKPKIEIIDGDELMERVEKKAEENKGVEITKVNTPKVDLVNKVVI